MFTPGQLVRVNLAGFQAEGVMFQAAVTDACWSHRETDFGATTEVPGEAFILIPWG